MHANPARAPKAHGSFAFALAFVPRASILVRPSRV
jgi:hypothetical protein